MQLEEITPELLKDTLKAFSYAQELPEGLLSLHCLKQTGSRVERSIVLQDYLYSVVTDRLTELRHAENLPDDRELALSCEAINLTLARDFSRHNPVLEAWSALYHRYVAPVSSTMKAEDLAATAGVTIRQFRRRVADGIGMLTERVRRDEMERHRSLRRLHLRRYLPVADYARLFGVDEPAERVLSLLTDPHEAPLVALDGLGGIGKTTLALAVAGRLADMDTFADILWVSARQTQLLPSGEIRVISQPVLTFDMLLSRLAVQVGREDLIGFHEDHKEQVLYEVFHETPYLIIVDNLETMEDYRALAPRLRLLADNTRFLLTTRHSITDYSFIHSFHVPPLSETDSLSLLCYELKRHGRSESVPSQEYLSRIYQIVGGLPLALKLVAGQLRFLPSNVVLDNLLSSHGQAISALYTYIYRRTWMLLDEPSRRLLLDLLTISPDGEDMNWIRLVSGLPDDLLESSIARLLDLALLQTAGTLERTFYRLHRLTITFLQTEILASWEERGPAVSRRESPEETV